MGRVPWTGRLWEILPRIDAVAPELLVGPPLPAGANAHRVGLNVHRAARRSLGRAAGEHEQAGQADDPPPDPGQSTAHAGSDQPVRAPAGDATLALRSPPRTLSVGAGATGSSVHVAIPPHAR